jgi:uncharacterized protein YndB with AHSA1/START domain
MTQVITPAPIRKSIHVAAAPARAFEIFTTNMSRWWLKTHTINPTKSPFKDIVIEPRAGGRWFERGEDGSECQWGKVLAWEPPNDQGMARLLLAWQINGAWQFDPTLVTEVELRFAPEGSGTLVTLEHRHLERLGERAPAMAEAFNGGWGKLLDSYAQSAA